MRKIICVALVFVFYGLFTQSLSAQVVPNTSNEELRRQMEATARREADLDRRMRAMRQLENRMRALSELDSRVLGNVPRLDKKARERVNHLRVIDPADQAKYAEFLRAGRTGIFRLFPDFDCVTYNYIRIDGDCANFVPESSSFSFRTKKYVDRFYEDIELMGGEITGAGFFSQTIFASLGDVPIEQIDPTHKGLEFLTGFEPALDASGARKQAAQFVRGVESGGYKYSQSVKPVLDKTYAIRSVAYKLANSLPPYSDRTSTVELKFHSLSFDKRADVIVVFRIVRQSADGNLTILWKELDRKDAPKLKFAKGEALVDFRG